MLSRRVFAAGRIGPKKSIVTKLARFCAWHGDWMSPEDKTLHDAGAPTTHGMCDECAAQVRDDFDRWPGPGAAA